MIRLFALALMFVPFSSLLAGEVSFKISGDDIIVSIGDEEFSRYHTSKDWKKPRCSIMAEEMSRPMRSISLAGSSNWLRR